MPKFDVWIKNISTDIKGATIPVQETGTVTVQARDPYEARDKAVRKAFGNDCGFMGQWAYGGDGTLIGSVTSRGPVVTVYGRILLSVESA